MTDNEKALMHQFEMAAHSLGTAQFLYNLMGGGCITKQQAKETLDFFVAKMKRDIESNPYLTSERKQHEISVREAQFNSLRVLMGI